jgi:hypothetical protein
MSWDSRFFEPIELPDGVKLASLREAIVHPLTPSRHPNAAFRLSLQQRS